MSRWRSFLRRVRASVTGVCFPPSVTLTETGRATDVGTATGRMAFIATSALPAPGLPHGSGSTSLSSRSIRPAEADRVFVPSWRTDEDGQLNVVTLSDLSSTSRFSTGFAGGPTRFTAMPKVKVS